MALSFIGIEYVPTYLCLSTDIINNRVEGAGIIGRIIHVTDKNVDYIICQDLTLKPYSVSSINPLSIQTYYNQIGVDAGGRTRVSQLTTLADLKTLNQDRTLLIETVGTGTNSFSVNQSTMSVTAGQFLIRQSRRFTHYFSGKSQLIEWTFRNFQPVSGLVKRVGYFSSNAVSPFDTNKDGFWLESDGTTIRLIVSRSGTETLNIPINEWDGYNNLEQYTNVLNWNRFTVIEAEFLWLGGAVLRLWIKTENGFTLAHSFHYAGSDDADSIFIASPNQPIRYEIRSTSGSGNLVDVCSQASTEGTINQSGLSRSIYNAAGITANSVGTTYPIKAMRKLATNRDIAIELVNIQLFLSSTQDTGIWTLQLNPIISGAGLVYTAVSNSSVEEANGGALTVTTPGTIIASGIITSAAVIDNNILEDNFLSYLGGSISNVMDSFVLCFTPITANITCYAQLGYKEY